MIRKIMALALALLICLPAMASAQGDEYQTQLQDALDQLGKNEVESVSLDKNTYTFLPGDSPAPFAATVRPEGAENSRVYWLIENESVATVDQNGLVTPRGNGTTTLIAETANGTLDKAIITVTDKPVTTISLNVSEYAIKESETLMLLVEVGPADADNTQVLYQSSDKSVAVVSASGKVFAKSAGECWITATAEGGRDVVARCRIKVEPREGEPKYLALTFDDGPCANTLDILEILTEYDVKATFFMLGQLVAAHPEYAKAVSEAGCELGNHSYDHSKLTSLDMSGVKDQIDKTDKAILDATGVVCKLCRAPGGSVSETIYTSLDRVFVNWSVDTLDWKYRDAEYVYDYVARNARSGAVVLMHDIRPTTKDALVKMIPALLEQGYTLVTVSELIEITGLKNGSLHYYGQ